MTSTSRAGSRQTSRARRVCGWMTAAVAAFAIYASLIPFEFQAVPMDRALARFEQIMFSPRPEPTSRTNYLANALLFVPLGFGLAGAMLADRPRRARAALVVPAVLAISLGVSCTAEFLQIFTPKRIVSRADVAAQTLGTLAGLATWFAAGAHLTRWVRAAADRQRGDRAARALSAYAVVWAFVSLAPFDLTVDLGALASRYHRGLISLSLLPPPRVPLSQVLWDAFAAMLSAAPLGALGLVGWTGPGARRRSHAAFAFGAAFVAGVEGAQVFIRSHAAHLTDVLWGLVGVGFGVWAGRRALQHRQAIAILPPRTISWRALAVLAAWCGVLCVYHWLPFDFTIETELIRGKLNRMSLVPFVGYWSGPDLNTFRNLVVKAALATPFGVIAAFVADRRPVGRMVQNESCMENGRWKTVKRSTAKLFSIYHFPFSIQAGIFPRPVKARAATAVSILAATAVFAGIETGQLLLPSRTPDPTDVLVSVAAAAVGLWIGRWLRS